MCTQLLRDFRRVCLWSDVVGVSVDVGCYRAEKPTTAAELDGQTCLAIISWVADRGQQKVKTI